MNAITLRQETVPSRSSGLTFQEVERLAEGVARSGMFGMKTKEQALALMMISQAEGRHPALAARDYDVIQSRPAKKAEAMLRDFIEAGGKIEWHSLSDTVADATFSHPAGGTVRITWDMERAKTAQLTGKDMYKKYPRQMLRSRCVSEGVRTVYPAATSGMYVPEEVADFAAQPATVEISTPTPPPAPVIEPPRAPITPEAWAQMGIDRLATFNSVEEVSAFEEKFEDKIVRLADAFPDLHQKLVTAIADRHSELGGQ